MAKLIYDGREYEINDRDMSAILNAVTHAVSVEPGWLAIGAAGGHVVQLFISPGVNIAVVTEQNPTALPDLGVGQAGSEVSVDD